MANDCLLEPVRRVALLMVMSSSGQKRSRRASEGVDRAGEPNRGTGRVWRDLAKRAFQPIDIAWLVFFRISFGLLLVWEMGSSIASGWVRERFIDSAFRFSYYGFEWLTPLPGWGMYIVAWALCVLGAFVVLGFLYRVAMLCFVVGFSYLYLLDQAYYLNHLYLVILLGLIMLFLPANRALSDDVLIWPRIRSETTPAWTLWILRAQIGLVYVFAAIAKINSDWLLRGEPVRTWMSRRSESLALGPWLESEPMVYAISWGGFLFDLLIVPLLLWRRTRMLAFVALIAFHLANHYLFNIGIFPWLSIAAATLFFDPQWARAVWTALVRRRRAMKNRLSRSREGNASERRLPSQNLPSPRYQTLVLSALGIYLALQVVVPFRHLLYPGNASWTEEGHTFAWRMLLRTKRGDGEFHVKAVDPDSGELVEQVWTEFDLSPRHQNRIWTRPEMTLEYAHYLADQLRQQGYEDVEVRARVEASLNARPAQLLIDPEVNLVDQKRTLWPASWILPLRD